MPGSWLDLPQHQAWLAREEARLSAFARAAADPAGGFGWLDEYGRRDPSQQVMTWITGRMTHVFALAHLRGEPGAGPLADHGIAALTGLLRDPEHGGWFPGAAQGVPVDTAKGAYEHAFVVIGAASATAAGRPGAAELLAEALDVVEKRFWDDAAGLSVEGWDRAWQETEAYRGANSNMHMIEAMLVAGDVTGAAIWHRRALRIAERLAHGMAAEHGWRLPEHFTPEWEPLPEYNADQKRHQFRPYGTTPGHALEWARLLVHLEAALGADAPAWLLADAESLFEAAVRLGWRADGSDGFVYTLDWSDRPVVRERMHWVAAEAVLSAAVLYRRTGDDRYEQWYRTWWDYIAQHVIDPVHGSWRHELDAENGPSATVWSGKPDVYHAYQAVLLPVLPLAASPAGALRS
ncbi:mannose/cellobiose epimerase-like protein (N-acyl-D-glucosamine 2-epimerase family) [Murinocardiopsis flavida]|uniref:Mannose/cellobiose epimerase-like protein (N-acyl-D-glucosamine 2-epimerase family) n=1 Tax=Murinocardiopsis flavida TaxID=645275 RepID=A0A2P8DMS2_9ACTN|nr:AGE family epimerase/isomerase [Murinocardiopsis flavida]PSK98499.1 mannose/cellobiose epimerase-like protein (N-acyl-D-glucosamine 2-epimerase family) [Murinocardiopsis flavida]